MPKCTLEKMRPSKPTQTKRHKKINKKKKQKKTLPRFRTNHEVNLKRCKSEIFCQTHNVHVLKQE